MVNEQSVFEPLKFYCILFFIYFFFFAKILKEFYRAKAEIIPKISILDFICILRLNKSLTMTLFS